MLLLHSFPGLIQVRILIPAGNSVRQTSCIPLWAPPSIHSVADRVMYT
jgi:hypothetical protein